MAVPVFCNVCFCEPRKPTPRFSLTSCGHVICEICLQKGKKDECLICRIPCHTLVLSKQTNPDIQSLFMGIDTLCKKYSKEISQISEFQEKHRKHLLAYNRQKTVKLEESLKKVTQQMHQIQCMKLPEQTTQCPFSSASRNPLSIPSRKQDGYSSCSLHPSHPSSSEIMESMEIDPVPSSMRKPETPTGPTRLSLITPPQDGRMGSVSYRGTQSSGIMSSQNSRAGSTRSTPIKLPHSGCSLTSSSGSQSSRRGSWAASDFRTPQLYPFTSPSPQSSVTRQPITISGLLQRQHLGATNLGGHSTER
ncbi:probable E3 SUMO-protein ligase RNF212 [Haliaeetus albicilla]|uniref:probable E3 SUMO-protein ligase RNF212 n=1 Tax=Haliaeetus leucocephalus TaxID=52644 RepID=UPI00053CADD2|nr:PREDICTED: probable E3 SUMO-protein ligase RNF212 [Haliaeetus leucocephalus]